jgi:uncharacterized protein YrzB (UPF0473 family)
MAIFETFEKFVDFMINKYIKQITILNDYGYQTNQSSAIVKFYIIHYPNKKDDNVYSSTPEDNKTKWEKIVTEAITAYNQIIGQ